MAALMDEVFFVLILNIQKQENAKEYSKILFGYEGESCLLFIILL
jgi:hypothetical protein